MDFDVLIAGGGPVGLLTASELALAGVRTCIVERLKEPSPFSKALTLHPRSIEILEMRGLGERFKEIGKPVPSGHFAGLKTGLDFSALDTQANFTLFIPQYETEKVLEEHARNLGVCILRGHEVLAVREHEETAELVVQGPDGLSLLTASYIVGADGAGSIIRKQARIAFSGTDANITAMLGDVSLENPPESHFYTFENREGGVVIVPLDGGIFRVIITAPHMPQALLHEPVTLEELKKELNRICGTGLGMDSPVWMSRFGNASKLAEHYRSGRIFLAGDAAHIHFPAGGQGLNVGLQDAMNLGWKLAAKINGRCPDWLLDSYHNERHPVGEALLVNTQIQTKLFDFTREGLYLRELLSGILEFSDVNRYLAEQIAALSVQYEADEEMPKHELNGKRLPDIDLTLSDDTVKRLYTFLRDGRFLLAAFGKEPKELSGLPHVRLMQVKEIDGRPEWNGVKAALIRPDGHVAWAVDESMENAEQLIADGIRRWCGNSHLQSV
ncbi:monooxygenase [Bacillus haynesii]|uniref:monooxygenase n=1 Tax=Bacillus haynesii TaxID=1925021 RepID=UPI002DBD9B6B|nr:monooxygenase [Bacillus haynesii]MEC1478630.1 monooxygenase [Bacillus haynesii]